MQMDLNNDNGLNGARPMLDDMTAQLRSLQFELVPTVRLPMPDKFSGGSVDFRFWKAQIKNFLNAHRSLYPTDSSKIALYVSLMKDDALRWVTPFIEDDASIVNDLSLFESALEFRFKEPACPVDSRLVEGQLQYKVHWKGYRVSQQSWESMQSLTNAPSEFHEYVRVFHSANPDKPLPSSS